MTEVHNDQLDNPAANRLLTEALESVPRSALLREDHLAERITEERERRGWSQERLARELQRHGYDLPQSSISRIEKPRYGERRRTISVDEMVGLSLVFSMTFEDLLWPVGKYNTQAVRDLAAGQTLAQHLDDSQTAFDEAVRRVATARVNGAEKRQFDRVFTMQMRLLASSLQLDVADDADLAEALLSVDAHTVEPPDRFRLLFLKAVLLKSDSVRPKPGRGPRRASTAGRGQS